MGDFPDHFKTQEMCIKAVEGEPETLEYVPDHLKTEEMCKEVVRREPYGLLYVPDHFKTQEMWTKATEKDLWQLYGVLITLKHKKCVKGLLKMYQKP